MTGRMLQQEQNYQEAIKIFKKCLTYDSHNEEELDELQTIVLDAMIQLMNSYQSIGEPEDCAAFLNGLRDSSSYLIKSRCQRDLYSILGYSLSRTEQMSLAEEIMKKALSMELYNPTDKKYFRDYAYAGAVFFSNPEEQEQVIQWCLLAVEYAKKSKNLSGVQWVNSMLGLLYKRTGKINESIELYQQSIEEARKNNDLLGEANAYNSIADLYLYYKLPNYANIYSNLSLQKRLTENPMIAGTSFLTKGIIMKNLGFKDSTLYYWMKADSCCKSLPYNSGKGGVDLNLGTLMIEHFEYDSLQLGIEMLKRVSQLSTITDRSIAFYQLARGYFKQKQVQKGEQMLDSMYFYLSSAHSPFFIETAYSFALKHYLEKGDASNIKKYANKLLSEYQFRFDDKTTQRLTKTIVDFKTEKSEQLLQQSKTELKHNQLKLRTYIIYSIISIVIVLIIFIYKRRIYRMKQKYTENELNRLLENLQETQVYVTTIEKQLSELYIDEENRKEIEAKIPHLLRERGEDRFRHHFEKLYPKFVPKLRDMIPTIGRKEELLCMLIALKQDNFQIEQIMGIAHSSVNMARYRLRQKMKLNKDTSLEDIIKTIIEESTH